MESKEKKYYEENKEKLKEYYKQWYRNNIDKVKKYRKENKDKIQEKSKIYREKNKEKIKQNWKEWYEKNPERSIKRRFTDAKRKAKLRNKEWALSFDEYQLLIGQPCYYCNYKLGERVRRASGLDRINSNIGYVPGNCVSCCYKCNIIKGQFLTSEETKLVVNYLLNKRGII